MDIATRMKSYENSERLEKGAVVIRVDGKGFHNWTRQAKLERPFDAMFSVVMQYAMARTANEMQGFRLAYTQSDECSFLLTNLNDNEGSWFDFKLQKLVSISASMFTHYFNRHNFFNKYNFNAPPAFFDARAFSIPVEDAANAFVWRQQDNKRNYVQAWAHANLPRKQVVGRSNMDLVEELKARDLDPNSLPRWVRYGTFLTEGGMLVQEQLDYYEINKLAGIGELNATTNDRRYA